MSQANPTSEEARIALAEASGRAAGVRRTDKQFRWILLALAAVYLAGSAIVALFPHGGSRLAGIALVGTFAGGLVGIFVLFWRMRAFSRTGPVWFAWAAAGFTWWNAAVCGVSLVTGWWGPHQPGTHFSVSALVAVLPLLAAAWLIGRR